jgi:hypothetical protein
MDYECDIDEYASRRDALIDEITAAFDGVSREDGTTMHQAVAIDDDKSPEEELAARRLDQERRWQDVPDDDINACCQAMTFMDEKGFRYYLPAFMIYGLKYSPYYSYPLSSCVYDLLYESGKSLRKSEPASIAAKYQLTDAQCSAAARFLRFIIDFGLKGQNAATVQAVEKWEKFTGMNPNI